MEELLEKIKKESCSKSFLELKTKVCDMYYQIYTRMIKSSPLPEVEKENFYDSIDFFIMDCVNKFKSDKGMKFSTFVFNMARFKALNLINKRKSVRSESFPEITDDHFDSMESQILKYSFCENNWHESEKKIDFLSLVDTITTSGTLETEEDKLIFDCRIHGEKKSAIVKRVSETFGCSNQNAYIKIKNLNNKIKKYE